MPDNEHRMLSSICRYAEFRKQLVERRVFAYNRHERDRGGRVAKRARKELIPQNVTSFLALATGNAYRRQRGRKRVAHESRRYNLIGKQISFRAILSRPANSCRRSNPRPSYSRKFVNVLLHR